MAGPSCIIAGLKCSRSPKDDVRLSVDVCHTKSRYEEFMSFYRSQSRDHNRGATQFSGESLRNALDQKPKADSRVGCFVGAIAPDVYKWIEKYSTLMEKSRNVCVSILP